MNRTNITELADSILSEIGRVVVGKDEVSRKLLAAIIAGGHILIEDVPGLAKTLIARSFSRVLDLSFSRIQFTPDLLPGDITGSNIFDQEKRAFEFLPGPVFSHVVLADEINRASPKTQSALLEAMQEQHVTVDGKTRSLESPFIVIATQNPIELEGTYPLPEAQLDRFMLRLSVGYPSIENEVEIILRRRDRKEDDVDLPVIAAAKDLLEMQNAVEDVFVDRSVAEYLVALVDATRNDRRVEIGASPRGSLALFKLSRSVALLDGRDFVTPDDIKAIAVEALAHRIVLKPDQWARRTDSGDIVKDALKTVPVPAPVPANE
jgi:MoxR-like ATPase